jgi:hypothetical protein
MRCGTALTAGVVFLLALGSPALAQRGGAAPKPAEAPAGESKKTPAPQRAKAKTDEKAKTSAKPAQPQAAPPPVVMPDAEKIVFLVRMALMTLNDAIQTGNFTVLRDKAAPGFREANSAARLGQIFSDLASRNVDLSVVSVLSPQLTEPPALDQEKGMLNIKGYFPTTPVQINFEMLYQSVAGRWQLFGISVQPTNAAPPPSPAPASPSANSDANSPKSQP